MGGGFASRKNRECRHFPNFFAFFRVYSAPSNRPSQPAPPSTICDPCQSSLATPSSTRAANVTPPPVRERSQHDVEGARAPRNPTHRVPPSAICARRPWREELTSRLPFPLSRLAAHAAVRSAARLAVPQLSSAESAKLHVSTGCDCSPPPPPPPTESVRAPRRSWRESLRRRPRLA